jgi:hypothetical protein
VGMYFHRVRQCDCGDYMDTMGGGGQSVRNLLYPTFRSAGDVNLLGDSVNTIKAYSRILVYK